jgi:orotate phosphoribosyltransferase
MSKRDELRRKALQDLQKHEVLMLDGHFDFGNGYHGTAYLNPHQLFRHPSTIWRFAQDLIDVVPVTLLDETDVVAGPVMGGALLAHTMAGLLDSRRALGGMPMSFVPFRVGEDGPAVSRFYRAQLAGQRVLLADDIRNTGQTIARCAELVREAGGTVIASCQICDRLESVTDLSVPNIALAEYRAPANGPEEDCPLCKSGVPVTSF